MSFMIETSARHIRLHRRLRQRPYDLGDLFHSKPSNRTSRSSWNDDH